jgi:hypothetical protein
MKLDVHILASIRKWEEFKDVLDEIFFVLEPIVKTIGTSIGATMPLRRGP